MALERVVVQGHHEERETWDDPLSDPLSGLLGDNFATSEPAPVVLTAPAAVAPVAHIPAPDILKSETTQKLETAQSTLPVIPVAPQPAPVMATTTPATSTVLPQPPSLPINDPLEASSSTLFDDPVPSAKKTAPPPLPPPPTNKLATVDISKVNIKSDKKKNTEKATDDPVVEEARNRGFNTVDISQKLSSNPTENNEQSVWDTVTTTKENESNPVDLFEDSNEAEETTTIGSGTRSTLLKDDQDENENENDVADAAQVSKFTASAGNDEEEENGEASLFLHDKNKKIVAITNPAEKQMAVLAEASSLLKDDDLLGDRGGDLLSELDAIASTSQQKMNQSNQKVTAPDVPSDDLFNMIGDNTNDIVGTDVAEFDFDSYISNASSNTGDSGGGGLFS